MPDINQFGKLLVEMIIGLKAGKPLIESRPDRPIEPDKPVDPTKPPEPVPPIVPLPTVLTLTPLSLETIRSMRTWGAPGSDRRTRLTKLADELEAQLRGAENDT